MKEWIKKSYAEVLCNPRLRGAVFLSFVMVLFWAVPALAANDFADMSSNISDQAKGVAGAAQMIFYLLGFVLVGVGLVVLAIGKEKKMGVIMMIVGIILTSIGVFISIGSGSFFGSDHSNVDDLFN